MELMSPIDALFLSAESREHVVPDGLAAAALSPAVDSVSGGSL